jgi:hypothetical protein
MPIVASNNGVKRELIPAGNYVARCYSMVHIGTVDEEYMGEKKTLNKVRIGWELPTETKVFKPENGEQPHVISQEFTLSLHEKSNLRKMLASWRGKDFSEEEAKKFDVSKLIGQPCMLNIIHKHSTKDPAQIYQTISSISSTPKGIPCPPPVNEPFILDYDDFDEEKFNALPDFMKEKMKTSKEYRNMQQPHVSHVDVNEITEPMDDLPF